MLGIVLGNGNKEAKDAGSAPLTVGLVLQWGDRGKEETDVHG